MKRLADEKIGRIRKIKRFLKKYKKTKMKKILILVILALLMRPFVPQGGTQGFAQDPYITIGKLKLRYDVDTNKLKMGFTDNAGAFGTLKFAKEFGGQLFDFNSQHFTWSSTTGLNLSSSIFQQDSVFTKNMTVGRDSTWLVMGEPVSKWRTYSLKKLFWANPLDGRHDLKWTYRSFNESFQLVATDSAWAINHAFTKYNNEAIGLDGNWQNKDTLMLQNGFYTINYGVTYQFIDGSSLSTVQDTIFMSLFDAGSGFTIPNSEVFVTHTYSSSESGRTGIMNWNIAYKVTNPNTLFLQVKCVTNASLIHFAYKDNIVATLVN